MNKKFVRFLEVITVLGCLVPVSLQAQIVPDATLPENSVVTPQGNVIQIDGGTTRGSNLFHSFQEFSVPAGNEALFNNAATISNILSRVTGGNISEIEGAIGANGSANLFLINPAGIVFGEGAFLNVGGSFIATTADSLLFPDGFEYSASNPQVPPLLTINAPIGLSFRDNPGEIVNRSIFDNATNFEDLVGLRVLENQTLALIGGDVLIEGGFVSTLGGRIELGSVAENSTVSITPVEKGFDFGYQEAVNFRDINLSFAALVNNLDANTGNIEVQGRNISLTEGSQIGITGEIEGQAGDINIIASESLTLDGNAAEVDLGDFGTLIFINIFDDATGAGSSINIDTPKLGITNGAQIASNNDFGDGQGADININASDIILEKPFIFENSDNFIASGILANVFEKGTRNGGNITISTEKLTLNEGAQISTDTFGSGNGGNLIISAAESIELSGTILDSNVPSALFANVRIPLFPIPTAGNGGDIVINTSRLVVKDGAQIGTTAQNSGNGGSLTINASESVLLSGTSSLATLQLGRSGIFVNVEPSFLDEESGEIVPTTGNGGTLNLTTEEFIVEQGAIISANTFSQGIGGNANINVNQLTVRDGGEIGAGSLIGVDTIDTETGIPSRGAGGNLNINATESVEITGTAEIDGEPVNSSLFTKAESTGDAGNLTLTTNNLTVSDGGEINTSASASGAAGNLTISANSLDLNGGSLIAETKAGKGNIKLDIDDTITLSQDSLISATATGNANGGNIDIDTTFIVASPNENNNIFANADQGTGGKITIDAESIFGIQERPQDERTNNIDASGRVDGEIIINTPNVDITKGLVETPQNVVEPDQIVGQTCRNEPQSGYVQARSSGGSSGLTIKGKGGVPPLPTEPMDSDAIIVDGKLNNLDQQVQSFNIQPIKTSTGDIYPARGIIKTEDGQIILTAYPTDGIDTRTPQIKANCTHS